MEHSFKRRRVSWRAGGSAGIHRFMRDGPVTSDKQTSGPGFKSQPSGAPLSPKWFSETVGRSPKESAVEESKLSHLHPRNLIPAKIKEAVRAPSPTVVASVVQVIVNDGAGSRVTQLLVPVSSKVVSVQGYAPITLGRAPAAASAAPSVAASPRNPYEQHSSPTPVAAPTSYATETSANAASRTEISHGSQPTGGAYGNPLSISVSGSNSQAVLSSPPSTPLPSSPASTTFSSPTGSYFSSSAPASSASNPGAASTSSSSTGSSTATVTPAKTSNAHNSPAPSQINSNSTITSSTQSGASTTSTDSSFINPIFSSFNANSTLVTTTRSRSTFASSVSSTSSEVSSRSSSTLLSSRSGSSMASETTYLSSSASSSQTSTFNPTSSASSTGGAVGGIGGPGSTASAPSSSATSGAGSGGGSSINTPAVVGGVVGGLAGLALILILLLFLLRWRRGKLQRRTISPPLPQSHPPGVASTAPTTQRSSVVPFASGGFFRRMRPGSGQTAETTETTASERGFQNFGGRRLESVLSSRGDGYSDPVPPSGVAPRGYAGTATGLGLAAGVASPASRQPGLSPGPSDNDTLSGSSFYRDSQGFYGGNEAGAGPSSPPPTSPTSGAGSPPAEGFAVTRPGPARTPVINQPGFAALRPPPGTGRGTPPPIGRGTTPPGTGRGTPPPRNLTPQPRQQDGVGRSHPSFDGSRGSRFAENV